MYAEYENVAQCARTNEYRYYISHLTRCGKKFDTNHSYSCPQKEERRSTPRETKRNKPEHETYVPSAPTVLHYAMQAKRYSVKSYVVTPRRAVVHTVTPPPPPGSPPHPQAPAAGDYCFGHDVEILAHAKQDFGLPIVTFNSSPSKKQRLAFKFLQVTSPLIYQYEDRHQAVCSAGVNHKQ